MKPAYKINDIVEIDNTNNSVKIIDFEIFDDLILYYTNDGKAYPESKLNCVGVNSLYESLNISMEEKNRQYQEFKRKYKSR